MGLSASQGRLLLLTAKQSDLEYRAQQISQKRLVLAQQLEEISKTYEDATSNRVMDIAMYTNDKDDDGKAVRTTGNLTYKNLLSGIFNQGLQEAAGIKQYSKTSEIGAYSNVAYRLTDTSGAIVVSSKDEILTEYKEQTKSTTYPGNSLVKDSSGKDVANAYIVTDKIQEDGQDQQSAKESYYIVATGALLEAFNKLSKDDRNVDFSTNGYVRVKNSSGDGYTIYNVATGAADDSDAAKQAEFSKTASLVQKKEEIPSSSITNTTTTTLNEENGKVKLVDGGDGKYTLYVNGIIKARYVVDPGLVSGSSGNAADPNYLQDCLRNGKYMLQKYTKGDEHNDATWNDMSWDATSNISDRYFTEDDAAAKAVYDRKQNEIQNADKKLELELDNVESQRNAVKTEIESVEKVINDNIDKSFKTFA